MAKYIQLARCYFNDKDLEDILGNQRFSQKILLQVARDRGVFLSADENREDIIRYLSLQHFDWNHLSALTARLNRDESEERRATVRLEKVTTIDAVEKATEKAKEELAKDRQTISLSKVNGRLVVNGTYIDIDPTRSKAVQRQERHFLVEFEVDKGSVKAEYTHCDKAGTMIASIIDQLRQEIGTKEVAIKRISLAGVKDPVLRTNFLLKIRSGLAGFRALDVLDLNVDHRFETEETSTNGNTDSKDEETSDTAEVVEVKSMLRSAALHGSGLLTNDLYQRLREKGYYVYKLVWSAKELDGDGRIMEFEVGFDKPVEGEGFSYDVKRILPTEAEKEAGKSQHEMLVANRPRVRRIIAESAYKALEEVEKKTSEQKNEK